jgi:hypothetical protein
MKIHEFWEKVEKSSGCWIWLGLQNGNGYGRLNWHGALYGAHRVAWEVTYGPIPLGTGYHGTCVLHKCDNRLCVRPDHLFLGTQGTNVADRNRKGNTAHGLGSGASKHPMSMSRPGEKNGSSKLTVDAVKNIKHRYATEAISQTELGRIYEVSQHAIWSVIHGKSWGFI